MAKQRERQRAPSGGSALKKLRSELRGVGLLGNKKNSLKKKRSATSPAQVERIQAVLKKENPFEFQVNRQKHEVLGRRVKGVVGRPGVSRLRGYETVIDQDDY
jgi:nucleolar protein 14